MKVIEVITIKSINQLLETLKKLENDNVSESFIKKVYRDLQERQTQPTKIAPNCGTFITTGTPLDPLISSFIKSENDKDFLVDKFVVPGKNTNTVQDEVDACKTFIKAQIEKFKEKDLADLADLTASIDNLSLEELKTKLENLKTKLKTLKTYDGSPSNINIISGITSEYANKITQIEAKIKEKNVEIENTKKKDAVTTKSTDDKERIGYKHPKMYTS